MSDSAVLLSVAYFPPISYFAQLLSGKKIVFEKYESYEKQSYRNRCHILSSNGILPLSIPIKKGSDAKILITDTRIDYTENWQQIHRRAIDSAYSSSPFHEYYMDSFSWVFDKKTEFLFDLNVQIIETLATEIEFDFSFEFTSSFQKEYSCHDLRNAIHPKKGIILDNFTMKPYTQVFTEKFGFSSDLSILDLLFNEGPNTESFLLSCL
jgi:hypothetical protein